MQRIARKRAMRNDRRATRSSTLKITQLICSEQNVRDC